LVNVNLLLQLQSSLHFLLYLIVWLNIASLLNTNNNVEKLLFNLKRKIKFSFPIIYRFITFFLIVEGEAGKISGKAAGWCGWLCVNSDGEKKCYNFGIIVLSFFICICILSEVIYCDEELLVSYACLLNLVLCCMFGCLKLTQSCNKLTCWES
jgi:hypothetical protein